MGTGRDHGCLVEVLAHLAAQGGFEGEEVGQRRREPVGRIGDIMVIHCWEVWNR